MSTQHYCGTVVYFINDPALLGVWKPNTRWKLELIEVICSSYGLISEYNFSLQITDSLQFFFPAFIKIYKIVTKHEIMLRENKAKFKKSGLECSEMLLLNESSKKMNSFTGTKVIYYAFHGCLPKGLLAK